MRIWRLLIAGLYLNCGFFVWAADATKLHILVAIDQEASGIGSMAQRSGSELVQRFNEIINSTTNPRGADAFNLAVIGNEGVDLSPRMIRGAIANLNVQPGESVLFIIWDMGALMKRPKNMCCKPLAVICCALNYADYCLVPRLKQPLLLPTVVARL